MSGPYITTDHWGHCRLCGRWRDLRGGVCLACAERAEAEGQGVSL